MTTTPQTEASRLADGLLAETSKFGTPSIQRGLVNGAIQELRRLDAENQRQRADLERKSEAIQRLWAERDQLRAQVERLQATEPFGYFRADAMGWADCAATDEGAVALYERPAAPAVPRGAEMPLSMNQFGRLVELTREHLSDNTFVFKATSTTGDTCHFGVESAAKAWAKGGSVEAIKVREFKLHTPAAPAQEPAVNMSCKSTQARLAAQWGYVPAPSQPVTLTDEEIDKAILEPLNALLDHIYEHTTLSEGILPIARKIANAIIAALREKEQTK